MRCSVVIPCHNGVELTRRCLDSLAQQRGIDELEILVVDNASTDGTAELAARYPMARWLTQSTNLGFAGGVNAGLRAATMPVVVVLNNDTQAAGNLLSELHRALVSDDRIGAVAPVSNFVKGAQAVAIGPGGADNATRERIATALAEAGGGLLQDVDSLAGLCWMLRRETLDSVGLLDERFGHGNFEDDDFCLRLRQRGYRLVIARAAFLHHEGHATFRALGLDIHEQLHKRRDQFVAKWNSDPCGRALLAHQRGDCAAAAAAALAARRHWPKWPDADWHIGRWLHECGEPAAAAEHFEALLAACPLHGEAALELAVCRLDSGDHAGAERALSWASESCHLAAEPLARALLRIGERWHREGRFDAAAGSFRDAIAIQPDHGKLHNWLGSCLLELGDLRAASAAFERAIELGVALAHTNLAICRHREGRREHAGEHFAKACELLPDDPVARANYEAFRGITTSKAAES